MADPTAHCTQDEPCTESKLLALHTSTVCLARALVLSGTLDRDIYNRELDSARIWLSGFDECGHNVKAFDELLEMLKQI